MATIERFEEMEVWQTARELVRLLYRVTNQGSWARDFGLKDQIRRAAVSIMSAAAEGFERGSDRDFRRFLFIAKASAGEVRSLLYVAQDVGYIGEDDRLELSARVLSIGRQLGGLIAHLDRGIERGKRGQAAS